ncbi:MAG: PPC domain-containing protein [bacterium]|nr:PPC domain-containing protein [bacterium]
MKTLRARWCALWALALVVSTAPLPAAARQSAATEIVFGAITDDSTLKTYPVTLAAGQAVVITVDTTSGDLDPVITLYAPENRGIAANNDDRSPESLDSALGYVSVTGGEYRLEVTRFEDTTTSGSFRLTITIGDPSVLDALAGITRVQLSGEMLTYDTEHFRIHYTLEGADQVDLAYVELVAKAVEETYQRQIVELGWAAPPSDTGMGGNAAYDLYIADLLGTGEGALGYASRESIIGDNLNSPGVEAYAATSYMQIDNDFEDVDDGSSPISLMRATVAHEFHHMVQFGYDAGDVHSWVYEAAASWIETITFPEDEDATGYVATAFDYPEVCFGTTNDPTDGQLQYGEWTFMQFLTDEYGDSAVRELWEQIALTEGFMSLETYLLARGGARLPDVVAAYRAKNLAREYAFAPDFNATVWMENIVTRPGRWTFEGQGIQELAANYYEVDLEAGIYYAGLTNDAGALRLYALGVGGGQVAFIPLERGGYIDTAAYDRLYLMVFNPAYDENVESCVYASYEIDLAPGKGTPALPTRAFDARYFEPLD